MIEKQRKQKKSMVMVFLFLMIIFVIVIMFVKKSANTNTVGGQKDEYGCLVSAGYSWCEARGECERSWEKYCTKAQPKEVSFSCENKRIISATFYPTDDEFVDLILEDGRNLSIPRAISASGARYTNSDESFVFWNKGDTAFIVENGTTTFDQCLINKN